VVTAFSGPSPSCPRSASGLASRVRSPPPGLAPGGRASDRRTGPAGGRRRGGGDEAGKGRGRRPVSWGLLRLTPMEQVFAALQLYEPGETQSRLCFRIKPKPSLTGVKIQECLPNALAKERFPVPC
jgi:hypothetical protein